MGFFPRSAFGQTVFLVAALLLINQIVSYVMVSFYDLFGVTLSEEIHFKLSTGGNVSEGRRVICFVRDDR